MRSKLSSGSKKIRTAYERRVGLRLLADSLHHLHERTPRAHTSLGQLMRFWSDIVGQQLALRCRPLRLRTTQRGDSPTRHLLLQVAPGFALEVQYSLPLLQERINTFLGYRCVDRISLRQSNQDFPAPTARSKSTKEEIRPEQRQAVHAWLEKLLSSQTSPRLKRVLWRLGCHCAKPCLGDSSRGGKPS